MMNYYDMWDDMLIPERWHLRNPVDERGEAVNPWQFKECRRIEFDGVLVFPLARPGGRPLDFTLAGITIPLLHRRVVTLLERLNLQHEFQLLPARVEGQSELFFVLNVLQMIRCIDDSRCREVVYWLPEDDRPDMVGEYRNVSRMKIDASQVGEAQIFRPWGWPGPIIVSERIKQALEQEGITGPSFVEV